MRGLVLWFLAVSLTVSPALADSGRAKDKAAAAKADAKTAAATKPGEPAKPPTDGTPANSAVEAELLQLKELLQSQATELEAQRAALTKQQQKMEALEEQLRSAHAAPGTAANNAPAATTLAEGSATPNTAATPQYGANGETKSPLSFKIGTADFTPGGFLDATAIFRSTNVGSGIGTSFGSIPFNNTVSGGLTETRFSAQNSRVSLKVNAKAGNSDVLGYVETDFLGFQPTNALVTSNSDTLRLRLYFADIRVGKWEFMGGQDWTMLTPNRRGIGVLPADIFYTQNMDTNYQVGLTWARQPQFRVIYHPTENWAMGVSIENPEQFTGGAVAFPASFSSSLQTQVNTGANTTTPNVHPDIIAKIAYDHKFGDKLWHVEAAGLLSSFKLFTPASVTGAGTTTNTVTGGGAAVNLNLEIFKNFRLIANSFWSDGGARYIYGLGPDFIVRQNGSTTAPFTPSPVHAGSGIGGFEWQMVPSFMLYGYYGGAYFRENTTIDPTSGKLVGFGFSGSSSSANRTVQEGTLGFIHTLWQNPNYGKLQIITQYSYVSRDPWSILGTGTGTPENAHASLGYIDLRYVLP